MTKTAVDYVTTLPSGTMASGEIRTVMFVVDLTFSQDSLRLVTQSIKKVITYMSWLSSDNPQATEKMEDGVLVGLLLVDGCVSLCHLKGKQGILDLYCIPGHTINMPAALRRPPGGFSSCIRPLSDARRSLFFALDALTTSKPQMSERMRPRCLGTAIHEALMAIKETREQGRSMGQERVVVITCGPPNHGPGSVPSEFADRDPRLREARERSRAYFDRLAEAAIGMNVNIDLYGVSYSPIGLSLIQTLPKTTGGVLSLHSVIAPDLFATQISESLSRTFGTQGMFDVRLSRGLRLSSMIGQVSERMRSEESGVRKLTSNACLLKSMEIGKSLSLFIEATSNFGHDDLYIQVLLSWKDGTGCQVERVVTRCISPTGNVQDFLKSVDPITSSVLIGKKAVLECSEYMRAHEKKGAEDVRNGLALKFAFMVQKFGKLLESKGFGFLGWRTETKWACPVELWYLGQTLYHLQRGSLLSRSEAHAEEVTYLQTAFLSTSKESADRMVIPKLFFIEPASLTLVELPAITTAMDSRLVMLIDHGLYIFIWIGSKTSETLEGQTMESLITVCQTYANRKCIGRGIMPELILVHEGRDDRSVFAHLTPSHKDRPMDKDPSGSSSEMMISKADEMSFSEWCRDVGVEPPKLNMTR